MKAVTTGKEFLLFYNDKDVWENGKYYAEDMGVVVNALGEQRLQEIIYGPNFEFLRDDDVVEVVGGYMVASDGVEDQTPLSCGSFGLPEVFEAWRRVARVKAKPPKMS